MPYRRASKSDIAPFLYSGPRVRMGVHAASLTASTISSRDQNGNLTATSLQKFSRSTDDGGGRIVYSGAAVTMTRVLSDAAAGGQIVLSETAAVALEKSRAACGFAVVEDLGVYQFTALTASALGAAASGSQPSAATALDNDYVVSHLYDLRPPLNSYMPWRDFSVMLRGTIRLELGHGLETPRKPSIAMVGQRLLVVERLLSGIFPRLRNPAPATRRRVYFNQSTRVFLKKMYETKARSSVTMVIDCPRTKS